MLIFRLAIDSQLSSFQYNANKIDGKSNDVIEEVLKGLVAMDKPFKYVVTCIMMQKNGAGLHTSAACYWDTSRDGT
jgi:dynein light chain Tctex-type 1